MSFQNYVCWQRDRVYTVLNTDAENIADEIFAAVHSDYPLALVDPNPETRDRLGQAGRRQVTPSDFLAEFLNPARRQVQAVMLGESGSGKSHFIHWLALQIPSRPDRPVLVIPKTGTSLRGVLEKLIAILPEERQRQYSERLERSPFQSLTGLQRRERLITEIEQAIVNDEPRYPEDDPLYDAEGELLEGLPYLFRARQFRERLVADDGLIAQLALHIADAPNTYERIEGRREFREDDLPLRAVTIREMEPRTASFLTSLLADREQVQRAVAIINRNRDVAIANTLNFSGEQLVELMLDIRRYLKQQGQSLVLLIEDFARLEGVDTALLQALIEAPSETNGLCELRWAMAVTRGYYDQLPNTVQTRMTHLVDMDVSAGGLGAVIGNEQITAFAARYLNAVRLQPAGLAHWYAESRDTSDGGEPPNACDRCPYRESCHAAFGTSAGVGLYPFTAAALANMAGRAEVTAHERFNPRRLIVHVLAEILGNRAVEFDDGVFPSEDLVRSLGGPKLPPRVVEELLRASQAYGPRQQALLELWSPEPGTPAQLADDVYAAFALPPPALDSVTARTPPDPETGQPEPSPGGEQPALRPTVRTAHDERIEAVRAWGLGGTMPERVASHLRELLYPVVATRIDWDQAGLEQSSFAARVGTNAQFRSRSAYFHNQVTQPTSGAITLNIPGPNPSDADLRQAAMALEGLLEFTQHHHWSFDHGPEMLAAFATWIERWAADVTEQILRLPDPVGRWDPVAAAVELLHVGATLGGRIGADATLTDHVSTLFEGNERWPERAGNATEWQQLYRRIRDRVPELSEAISARASGGKGGIAGGFVDPGRIVPALRRLRRTWGLSAAPPGTAERRDTYGRIAALWNDVRDRLPAAAEAELDVRRRWLAGVREQMPEGATRADVVRALRSLRETVTANSIGCRQTTLTRFDRAFEDFGRVQFDDAVRAAEALSAEGEELVRRLPDLARDRANAVEAGNEFFPAAVALLDEVQLKMDEGLNALGSEADELDALQGRIDAAFALLDETMLQLEGAYADSSR